VLNHRLSVSVRQETEVSYLDETAGQHMQQEAANELHRVQRHFFNLVAAPGVAPAEADSTSFEGEQSTIRDGDAVSVACEIAKHLIRPAKRGPDADHPVHLLQLGHPFLEADRVREFAKLAVKREPARGKRFLQIEEEFAAEEPAEGLLRQKELDLAGGPPALPIRG